MSLNYILFLETQASLLEVAETVLGPSPNPDTFTDGYRGRVGPDIVDVLVCEDRPMSWDPVVTDLAVDYRIRATFTLDKWAPIPPQTTAIIGAADAVRTRHGGTAALLFERDIVILRWSDDGLVVNEGSSFLDHALAVVGDAARVEPIPWH